mmetsp:Transcript_18557/g.27184  ORF Transcript_18557/g.27184 Transcript_18557/m.27184 type:complete len:176 (-) Transcript_18557:117-644(-)
MLTCSGTDSMQQTNKIIGREVKVFSVMKKPGSKSKHVLDHKVSFSFIEIREYPRILGDHPGTGASMGPSISIDWNYNNVMIESLEAFETNRYPRRSPDQLHMPSLVRKRILKSYTYTDQEIETAQIKGQLILRQRHQTFVLVPFSTVEEFYQSAKRKLNRLACKFSLQARPIKQV